MFDCANVEVRELLPDLAAGTLDAATRARLEQHVVSCAECASELETLRLVRSAYASTPAVDVRRIVSALPGATTPAPRIVANARNAKPVRRWMDWRVAAALTMFTVGGLSLALDGRLAERSRSGDSPAAVLRMDTAPPRPADPPAANGNVAPRPGMARSGPEPARPVNAGSAKAQLAFAGGGDDLDDASLQALLGALDEIDRAPVAPPAEPDPTPVLPVIRTGER
jgi:hypothetical protein